MQEVHVTFTSVRNAIFNAHPGEHDDLVLAVAMAMFGATQPPPVVKLHMGFAR